MAKVLNKYLSGLDFSDRGRPAHLDQHVDMANTYAANEPSHLQRNKTERWRLQGIQRTTTGVPAPMPKIEGWRQRMNVWMINEGGRRLFFYTICLLHIIVFVFGWLHYSLKDNLVTSRATFGITFGASRCQSLRCRPDTNNIFPFFLSFV